MLRLLSADLFFDYTNRRLGAGGEEHERDFKPIILSKSTNDNLRKKIALVKYRFNVD